MVLRVETVESDFDTGSKVGLSWWAGRLLHWDCWERGGVSTVVLRLGTEARPSPFDL